MISSGDKIHMVIISYEFNRSTHNAVQANADPLLRDSFHGN